MIFLYTLTFKGRDRALNMLSALNLRGSGDKGNCFFTHAAIRRFRWIVLYDLLAVPRHFKHSHRPTLRIYVQSISQVLALFMVNYKTNISLSRC